MTRQQGVITAALLSLAMNSHAGQWLTQDVTIDTVNSTAGNQDTFEITFTDPTSTSFCSSGHSGSDIVAFPASVAGNAEIHKRNYTAAMTAMTLGLKVNIYSYEASGVCWNAAYIEVVR